MSDGFSSGMREGERRAVHAKLLCKLRGDPVKHKRWPAAGLTPYLNVPPAHSMVPACAQGLHAGFLGCETGSKSFDAIGFGFAVTNLVLRKNPPQKAVAETLNGGSHARDFDNVDARTHNHDGKVTQATLKTPDGSEQLVTTIDHGITNQSSLRRELMSPRSAHTIDVQHLVPVGDQIVGYQHTMTAKINSFRAHVSGT